MNRILSIIAMCAFCLIGCTPADANTDNGGGNKYDEFEGGFDYDFVKEVKLVMPTGTVKGQINPVNHEISFRHIPMGSEIKSALIETIANAEVVTNIDKFSGNWPKEVKFVVKLGEDLSSYKIVLEDYVGESDPYYLNESKWVLTWSDEFNAESGIDWSVWKLVPRHSPEWANKMSSRADLTVQKDGNLEVWAKVGENASEGQYVTGGLWGEGLKGFKMGRMDVRAKKDFALSFWPAIWMMPNASIGWPNGGEIDIMEHLNYDNIVYQTVHSYYTENVSKTNPVDHSTTIVDTRDYHIYSVEVYEDMLVFLVDNKIQLVYKKDASKKDQFPFTKYDFYMILSAQLGGQWPGDASGKDLPAAMYVDFVRYYTPSK